MVIVLRPDMSVLVRLAANLLTISCRTPVQFTRRTQWHMRACLGPGLTPGPHCNCHMSPHTVCLALIPSVLPQSTVSTGLSNTCIVS